MKLKAVAVLLILCLTRPASAQIVVVVRPGDTIVFGSGLRSGYSRSYVVGTVITVKRPPILGPGYSQDTRGVDLDLVPAKKSFPSADDADTDTAKPLPGVDVSNSRPPVRPGDAKAEVLPPANPPPPLPTPPLPRPPGSLADPLMESARLMQFGLEAFQVGAYGLAAQRFRQAAEIAPSSRGLTSCWPRPRSPSATTARRWRLFKQASNSTSCGRVHRFIHASICTRDEMPNTPSMPNAWRIRLRPIPTIPC